MAFCRYFILSSIFLFVSFFFANAQQAMLFRNEQIPTEQRIKDLIERLTIEEKISLLGYKAAAIPRLNIPAYNWWNEALHGVARAGLATVFPQAIAMAATFNDSLHQAVADAISTEGRAKFNLNTSMGRNTQYMGLTYWSPNINIFRDPRWGRGQETYGEDPFLTATMGAAFVKGIQGNDPRYMKATACAKHFAVHSGPEAGRHSFNAIVDEKDLRETYLYAFKKLVNSNVESVMCAYNRLNDEPCCTGSTLLKNILYKEWKFKGHVVTDCGALYDILDYHKLEKDPAVVAAAAIKAGVNLDCSSLMQKYVQDAINKKLLAVNDIDAALTPLFRTQFKLGFFDGSTNNPYAALGVESVHSAQHIVLAKKAALQSIVLLKNDKNILPFPPNKYASIMVLGANAGAMDPLVANYHGMSGNMVSFAEGITAAAGPAVAVQYDQGSDFTDTVKFGGIWAAGESDISIAVIGLTPVYEGEEGDAFLAANGGDKLSLDLPAAHIAMLKQLRKKNKPVVVVVTAGSNVDIAAIEPYADAILLAWYPGEQGGNAVADIIFGNESPAGRLPVTFYSSLKDIPAYDNYSMKDRTYRYYSGKVQYPFGFGLSYSSFDYAWKSSAKKVYHLKDTINFEIDVKNTGNMNADEVVQVYIKYPDAERMPFKELKAFKRINVIKNDASSVSISIPVSELQKWDLEKKSWKTYHGTYHILIGNNSADVKLQSTFAITK